MVFKKLSLKFLIVTTFLSTSLLAKDSFKLGVAYDFDAGLTAQYNGYSFFANEDAAAIDYRVENFTNSRKNLHFYVDIGGFIENYKGNNSEQDDRVGVRVPVGMTFGFAKDFQAYIQAVPNYDFNNDRGFDVDGAIGVRYQF